MPGVLCKVCLVWNIIVFFILARLRGKKQLPRNPLANSGEVIHTSAATNDRENCQYVILAKFYLKGGVA